jgi:hypothetical protein
MGSEEREEQKSLGARVVERIDDVRTLERVEGHLEPRKQR